MQFRPTYLLNGGSFTQQGKAFAVFVGLLLSLSFSACTGDDDDDSNNIDFDRSAMLSYIANDIIVSSYQALQAAVSDMDAAVAAFQANPTANNLADLQIKHKAAWMAWQRCSMYEFGPAGNIVLRQSVNTFPTDTAQINSSVSTGVYDLEDPGFIDAKGFPALDYLLNGLGNDNTAILAMYTTDPDATSRSSFLFFVSGNIKVKVDEVVKGWTMDGYLTTFINAGGTDVGSSLGQLVNELIRDYEEIKNARIGIPLGKRTLGTPLPEKVEALYGGYSILLANAHLKAIEDLYLGVSFDRSMDSLSLDDYLIALNAQYNGGSLSNAIRSQLMAAKTALSNVNDPLSDAVINDAADVEAAYQELQKLVVLLKTDMASAIGILITFQDNDGD